MLSMSLNHITDPVSVFSVVSVQVYCRKSLHAKTSTHQPSWPLQWPLWLLCGQLGGPPDLRHLQRWPELPLLYHSLWRGTQHCRCLSPGSDLDLSVFANTYSLLQSVKVLDWWSLPLKMKKEQFMPIKSWNLEYCCFIQHSLNHFIRLSFTHLLLVKTKSMKYLQILNDRGL